MARPDKGRTTSFRGRQEPESGEGKNERGGEMAGNSRRDGGGAGRGSMHRTAAISGRLALQKGAAGAKTGMRPATRGVTRPSATRERPGALPERLLGPRTRPASCASPRRAVEMRETQGGHDAAGSRRPSGQADAPTPPTAATGATPGKRKDRRRRCRNQCAANHSSVGQDMRSLAKKKNGGSGWAGGSRVVRAEPSPPPTATAACICMRYLIYLLQRQFNCIVGKSARLRRTALSRGLSQIANVGQM